ncbi:VOC family protein [Amycolatopsis rhizosphaerae]|uniref:VOC family protein n=1 Tax=Amycolatopsis rhizosphaerae TaxID=2053003 RepID=A0A558CCN1_9PSEU|nr:VOC family protein [Amycolatopsis rhizosphaerae]TVT46531.1 VOC family protein [Amycolatopsis rhizosphaerae]
MAYDFQVTVDCADPHSLADWWAEALGWPVEPSDEAFIRRMVETGQARDEDTTTHRGVLVWKIGAAIRHPDSGRRILFQAVPEAKSGKNRVHLDVFVGKEKLESELDRLTAAGATLLHRGQQGPFTWVTIADPEGNELCLTGKGTQGE